MEISAGFNFNTSADHLQQYWAVDEVMSCVFNEEILILDDDDDESRPLKQLRRAEINSSTNRNLAERNRREKMSQKFAALSALLPASKKRDKACILEEAIKNITQLQKRVDTLEKKTAMKSCSGALTTASNQSSLSSSSWVPLIEAKSYHSEVLITIHYETVMCKGVLESIVGEIEKLHLSVVSFSLVHFGHSHLNITIIAQMEEEYGMSIKEVVNNLHMLLSKYKSTSTN